MGGLGNIPSGLYESSLFEDLGSVSGTTHSMTHPVANVNDIIVVINNVIQEPTAAYTVSGTTLTTATLSSDEVYIYYLGLARQTVTPGTNTVTNAMMTVNSIDSDQYVDASIDNAHLADDAVGLDELSATGTPSSSTFLRGDNAWATPSGGAWKLIGSQVATDDADLSQTGLDSTYDTYAIVLSDILMAVDAQHLYLRFGDSGGYDSGSTDYFWHLQVGVSASGYGTNAYDGSADPQIRVGSNLGNASGEGMGALFYLSRPGDGTSYPMIHGTWSGLTPSTTMEGGVLMGIRTAVITLDRLQIYPSSGNITSGRMSVYGISHS